MSSNSEPRFCTVRQACAQLAVGRTKIYALLASNNLEAIKIGRATRISMASISRLADERLAAARAQRA